jgi:hypothetical protein
MIRKKFSEFQTSFSLRCFFKIQIFFYFRTQLFESTNIKLECRWLKLTNKLAYYDTELITGDLVRKWLKMTNKLAYSCTEPKIPKFFFWD